MIEMCGVQDILKKEMEENILLFYEKLIKKYISEKELIPQGNLVEIKFEELEADPLINLRHVYEELNLPGFEQAAPLFSNYIASMGSYRKNQYAVDDDVVRKVRGKWQFTINEFKYDHPEEIPLFPRMQEDQEQSDNAKQEGLFQ
jgi:hypothetical protein